MLLVISVYVNSRAFKDRADRFKRGYIRLQDLSTALEEAKWTNDIKTARNIYMVTASNYSAALLETENHKDFDDLYSRYCLGQQSSRKLSLIDKIAVIANRFFYYACLATLYVGPVLAFVALIRL